MIRYLQLKGGKSQLKFPDEIRGLVLWHLRLQAVKVSHGLHQLHVNRDE
jgi:hypothetical protein